MTILIILLVLAMIAGPVMMAMPSRRERALAALREDARRRGFTLQLAKIDHPSPAPEERVSAGGIGRRPMLDCVAYRLARAPAAKAAAAADDDEDLHARALALPRVQTRLLRRRDAHDPDLPAGWVLDSDSKAPDAPLRELLPTLGDDIVAIESAEHMVALYWLERGGTARLAELDALLRQLLARQLASES